MSHRLKGTVTFSQRFQWNIFITEHLQFEFVGEKVSKNPDRPERSVTQIDVLS